MTNFIFMLTHHDVTIKNALEIYDEVKDTGLKCIGCKDIGLPDDELKELIRSVKKKGITTFLELVSYEKEATINTLMKAGELNVDYLIGGMPLFTDIMMKLIKEKRIKVKYFPYAGGIVGHPCVLKDSIDYIANDAKKAVELGVAGINLLAYRHREEDPHQLLKIFIKRIHVPTVVAGDINSFERIREVTELGYWGFTIGGAILEKRFVPDGSVADQIRAVLDACNQVGKY